MATDGRTDAIIDSSTLVNFLRLTGLTSWRAIRPTASLSSMLFATTLRSTLRPRSRGSTPR